MTLLESLENTFTMHPEIKGRPLLFFSRDSRNKLTVLKSHSTNKRWLWRWMLIKDTLIYDPQKDQSFTTMLCMVLKVCLWKARKSIWWIKTSKNWMTKWIVLEHNLDKITCSNMFLDTHDHSSNPCHCSYCCGSNSHSSCSCSPCSSGSSWTNHLQFALQHAWNLLFG